jgi:hypothetical protein
MIRRAVTKSVTPAEASDHEAEHGARGPKRESKRKRQDNETNHLIH